MIDVKIHDYLSTMETVCNASEQQNKVYKQRYEPNIARHMKEHTKKGLSNNCQIQKKKNINEHNLEINT